MQIENAAIDKRGGRFFFMSREDGQWFARMDCPRGISPEHVWLIPGEESAQHDEQTPKPCALHLTNATLAAPYTGGERLEIARADYERHPRFPHTDALGQRVEIDVPGHADWADTLAAFYWDTLLPCTVERSADCYPDGYVLSTLQTSVYGGTYPDVDHEFQCKGRVAMGGEFDLDLVRRMIELECRLMREDPTKLWRVPCAMQASGAREYHVRRNSMNRRVNADMFLITGNVEVIQSAWLYYCARKDTAWLGGVIEDLEGAASLTESMLDRYSRLWSDVYYEDQVMKDGSECMSAALAANGFGLLARLEELLGRAERAKHYAGLERRMAARLAQDAPMGFWDADNSRFIDWLDRDGVTHDHLHLLANVLPALFGYCDDAQARAVAELVNANLAEYQRFPTFLSARIQDYTDSEIGDGGPYDLCAAGRYWCWDAAYWHFRNDGARLERQLAAVSEQAWHDNYRMGERYDMNHVYYQSDRNWHGAAYYYEYPCVYSWVLIHEYAGLRPAPDADWLIQPMVKDGAHVLLESHGVEYTREGSRLRVRNLCERDMRVNIDLRGIGGGETSNAALRPGEEMIFE